MCKWGDAGDRWEPVDEVIAGTGGSLWILVM